MLNIHPSLLPSFKGLDTHQRALDAGVAIHGCTVHVVRPEMDQGPIIAQAAVPVHFSDTANTLAERVLQAEHRLYPMALALFANGRVKVAGEKIVHLSPVNQQSTLYSPSLDTSLIAQVTK
jgi:phosphoribosylglycinamide formyltransferase-1